MTGLVFRDRPYARSCAATVTAAEGPAIELDRTVFYPMGGGQPGDTGRLVFDGGSVAIVDTRRGGRPGTVLHLAAEGAKPPPAGTAVSAEIDWKRRHRIMRVHTCLHLLSALLPYPVTGGQVGDARGRLDFDIPEAILDKATLTGRLNALIEAGAPVREEWIADEELAARPDLVKTMAVAPPTGAGKVRLIRIEGHDLQPCGGTHLDDIGEIGRVAVTRIEKKGRRNRRVAVALAEAAGP